MQRMMIVDGSGFMFRAWYAFPPMPNEKGENMNVVYGFIRMMIKLLLEDVEYFVIARDSPIKTKRHEKYPDYKGTRPKIDDDFKRQIPLIHQLIGELQLGSQIAPGYEADDIIGTFVNIYKTDPTLLLEVMSSDKDLKQLLAENVIVTDPLKNLTTRLQDFEREYGFAPIGIVDYLALIGDQVDNVKGVAGIGPKSALQLVQEYGSVENIYHNLDKIPEKLRNKLIRSTEDAYFSKELIQLLLIPELNQVPLEQWKININLEKREKILIQERKFTSLQKLLDELKKKKQQPQQLGLF